MISKINLGNYSPNPYQIRNSGSKRANNSISFTSKPDFIAETMTKQTEGLVKKAVSILEEKVSQFMKAFKQFQAEKEAELGIVVSPSGFDPPEYTPAYLRNKAPINGYKEVSFADNSLKPCRHFSLFEQSSQRRKKVKSSAEKTSRKRMFCKKLIYKCKS